jgi:osmotically-inducible protein OsmY
MKIKFLTVLTLAAFLLLVGCRGSESNTNTNANANANKTNTNTAATTPAPARDTATETVVKEALTKKNFNDVTVEATTTGITLRGSVPKGKMAEAVQAAQEAGKKPVKNELTEK